MPKKELTCLELARILLRTPNDRVSLCGGDLNWIGRDTVNAPHLLILDDVEPDVPFNEKKTIWSSDYVPLQRRQKA